MDPLCATLGFEKLFLALGVSGGTGEEMYTFGCLRSTGRAAHTVDPVELAVSA